MTTKFTAQTFAWLRQINTDKRVLAIDVKIALELTRYFREKDQGGRAYPSAKTLGDAVGLSERSARRSIDRLQQAGHLHVIPGKPGRGCSAQYWMILKTRTATPVFEAQKTGLRDRQKTGIRGKKTGTATPQSLREPILDGECLRTPPSRGREFALTRESISSDPGGRPDGGPGSVSSHGVGARLSPGRETKGNSSEEHRPMLETMANLPCRTVKQAGDESQEPFS
jgi:hypothetical protein